MNDTIEFKLEEFPNSNEIKSSVDIEDLGVPEYDMIISRDIMCLCQILVGQKLPVR